MTREREVRDGYDAIAETYLSNRDCGDRERELVESLAADLPSDSRVLDAGCGAGSPGTPALRDEHEVVGLDSSIEQLVLARERIAEARLVQGDLTRLPFGNGAFDGLVSLHAVIHVPRERHTAVFEEFRRVLGPGGHLLVTTGAGPWEGRNPDWLDTGVEMFWSFHGRERSIELLTDAGFVVEDETVVEDELGGGEWLFARVRAV